ncbi:hypothetical protein [Burkholderia seminalis]|uniref:hypothetical protein n=1 Tax=Burkholderia seminalis TaxID=488731 RepID=UPI0031D754D8
MTAPATVVRQAGIRIGRFDNRIGERVYRMRVVRIVQSSIVERRIANAWPTNGGIASVFPNRPKSVIRTFSVFVQTGKFNRFPRRAAAAQRVAAKQQPIPFRLFPNPK